MKETAISNSNWFKLIKTSSDSRARLGCLITPHGTVETPVFMPVGSQATVKGVTPLQLKEIDIRMILANNYHLYLRPGIEIIRKMGGLHKFMDWDRVILTDSGGFQVFSLSRLRKIQEEGVKFQSHIDGSEHFLSPELAVELQEGLGADVIMALDICPSFQDKPEQVKEATQRTHRWAERCLKAQKRSDQALFGIVQGGFNEDWRKESATALSSLDFPGYALGGLSLGEPREQTQKMIAMTAPLLPDHKPRYLMGVGSPEDILFGVEQGIDMFDSVLPTRVARNGGLYTPKGRINIRNSRWKESLQPIDPNCSCYTCNHFSAAYLHHLFRTEELLGYTLATLHNLSFLYNFMKQVRQSISQAAFNNFKKDFLVGYQSSDEQVRITQKQKWLENWEQRDGIQKEGNHQS